MATVRGVVPPFSAVALQNGLGVFADSHAIGIAAAGGGIGQGRGTAAALEGIARNPSASGRIFTPFILGLALIESLVIYAFVIAILMNVKWSSVVDGLMTQAGMGG